MNRQQEIRAIWTQYQGLYIVAGILIGLLLFPFLELVIIDFSNLLMGLIPEAIGIGFTVFLLDKIYEHRELERLKNRLVREAGSQSNETAKSAIDWLRAEGWLSGDEGLLKKANLKGANLANSDLRDANLESAILTHANLTNSDLRSANLDKADLSDAQLEDANLETTDLDEAILRRTNLKRANIMRASLNGANLADADAENASFRNTKLMKANLTSVNFQGADMTNCNLNEAFLLDANLRETTLFWTNFLNANLLLAKFSDKLEVDVGTITAPDGNKIESTADMSRFTDKSHFDFWSPSHSET